MIKICPDTDDEQKIRKLAAQLNLPLTQFLAPFMKAIANEDIVLGVLPKTHLKLPTKAA